MIFRVLWVDPEVGRVSRFFSEEDVFAAQELIGELQLKGINPDVKRLSKDEARRDGCPQELS